MFYQVKILDAAGKLKKVISSKSLSNRYWQHNEQTQDNKMTFDFEELEEDHGLGSETVSRKSKAIKMDDSLD